THAPDSHIPAYKSTTVILERVNTSVQTAEPV
ncbi:hypothetical protein MGSAQ_000396, partial [marine sediment metagenome]